MGGLSRLITPATAQFVLTEWVFGTWARGPRAAGITLIYTVSRAFFPARVSRLALTDQESPANNLTEFCGRLGDDHGTTFPLRGSLPHCTERSYSSHLLALGSVDDVHARLSVHDSPPAGPGLAMGCPPWASQQTAALGLFGACRRCQARRPKCRLECSVRHCSALAQVAIVY